MVTNASILCCALAVVLVPFAADPAVSDDDSSPDGVMVLGNASTDHEGELQTFECEGEPQLALGVVDAPGCGDYGGDHVIEDWPYYIILGFRIHETGHAGPIPLTGSLEGHLFWDGGEKKIRCHWDQGEWIGCDVFTPSLGPPPGETFGFRCASLTGTIGHWGDCFMAHS